MSFVAYNQELVDTTIKANQRSNVRSIVVAIIAVIVVIILALVIYFIVRYIMNRQAAALKAVDTNTKCLTDANCPSSASICQNSTGLCVQCRDNTQCSGSITKCNPTTNSCVQCLTNADCPTDRQCRSNICLEPEAPPVILNARWITPNSLQVRWTPILKATSYIIKGFPLPGGGEPRLVTVPPTVTDYTISPTEGWTSAVIRSITVTAVTPFGNLQSLGLPFLIRR